MQGETLTNDGRGFLAENAGGWRESFSDLSPHPVRRWVARHFDGFVTAGVACGVLASPLALFERTRAAPLAVVLLLYLFGPVRGVVSAVLNALLLRLTSTTPGKWLCGVRIVRKDGGRLTFGVALKREFEAFVGGCGLYVPLVVLVVMAFSFRRLCKRGATSWDEQQDLVALQRPNSLAQGLLTLLALLPVVVAMISIAVMGLAMSEAAKGAQP